MPNPGLQPSSINIRGIAPLLLVYDMPASIRFYRDMLGFAVKQTAEIPEQEDNYTWALLELNGVELMMEPKYPKNKRPATFSPEEKDIKLYFGCPDVEATYEQLRAKGLPLQKPAFTGYGFKALSFRDPDGFLLIFHWPQGN